MDWEKIYEEETGEPSRLNSFPGTNNGKHREEFFMWLQKKLDSVATTNDVPSSSRQVETLVIPQKPNDDADKMLGLGYSNEQREKMK